MNDTLGGAVLKSVSRSFYLTIRALPRGLRAPIGLAYLLARISDTIADSPQVPVAVRLLHLEVWRKMIEHGADAEKLRLLREEIVPADAAEVRLIARAGECLQALEASPEADRADITEVLRTIIRGQDLDLRRFPDPSKIVALPDAAALDEYTFLVAGCVGEFWTRLCFRHLRHFARVDQLTMEKLGRRFGQGLQLVNILRDLPADLRAGRCYLPADELLKYDASPSTLGEFPERARLVVENWRARATDHFAEAQRYIAATRSWRLRFATLLPWAIGVRTLQLLRARSPLGTNERVKVSHREIRVLMWRALFAAFSNASLARWSAAISTEKNSAASR